IVLNRVRFNRRRRDGTYGYGHFRRADAPPSVAPVVPANAPPTRSPRVPANGRRTGERSDALRMTEPTVLRSSGGEVPPGTTAVTPPAENQGQTGYWQR
ncbi:MAG TPA: hypothetical protein VK215_00685, partial [Acidimicrobiales bacterium]|nr:hypothetical protein [Acidimicrobiales bacterium]